MKLGSWAQWSKHKCTISYIWTYTHKSTALSVMGPSGINFKIGKFCVMPLSNLLDILFWNTNIDILRCYLKYKCEGM